MPMLYGELNLKWNICQDLMLCLGVDWWWLGCSRSLGIKL
jgi:hypothetical protein